MKTVLAVLLCSLCPAAFAGDDKLLTPYPGSVSTQNESSAHDAFEVPLGPTKDGKLTKGRPLEGRVTTLQYRSPDERSALEIYRNYEAALRKAGFKTLYACKGPEAKAAGLPECGDQIGEAGGFRGWPYGTSHYLAAMKTHQDREIWVALDIQGPYQKMYIIRPAPMEMGKVTVNAAALKNGIEEEGHVAVYGVEFDTNKAALKPASAPILAEIAKLLKASPALSIYVVGHTDAVGGLESNMGLSLRRAAAVVKQLVSAHGVAEERLAPHGVGPLVPLATNGTDEGRAKNRRVDLVKR